MLKPLNQLNDSTQKITSPFKQVKNYNTTATKHSVRIRLFGRKRTSHVLGHGGFVVVRNQTLGQTCFHLPIKGQVRDGWGSVIASQHRGEEETDISYLLKDVKLAGGPGLAWAAGANFKFMVLTQKPRAPQGCPSLALKTRDPWLACISLQLP